MSDRLNAGQAEVLASTARRIVVSAGAGSGKTRVLAERFVAKVLAAEAEGRPSPMRAVLLITFTDKAAGELTERVRRMLIERARPDLAREVDGAWISTIHGFCSRIVRRHALELGIDPAFTVLAEPQGGVMRCDSFERTALACCEDPVIARLVETRGAATVRKLLLSRYDSIRSKGVGVAEARPADPGDLPGALAGLERTLGDVLPQYRKLRLTDTVAGNLTGFVELGGELTDLLSGDTPDRARVAAAGFARFAGKLRGDDETKRLTGIVNEAIHEVLQAVLDCEGAAYACGWAKLLLAFDETYNAAKEAAGVLDFEDLQLRTRELWRRQPQTAARYAQQFLEVMVDEFQDTNTLQVQVIEPVAAGGLCVVGDAQQSIYGFRDADVRLFAERRRAAREDPEAQECRLTVNYRSDRRLLDALNTLFSREDMLGDEYLRLDHEVARPSLIQWPDDEPRVEALVVDKSTCGDEHWRSVEAAALARRLRAIVNEGRACADDIVVLLRAATDMRLYADALRASGFTVLAGSAGGFYRTPEVAAIRSLLCVLANPLDAEGVIAFGAGGLGGLSDDAMAVLAAEGRSDGPWAALRQYDRLGLAPHDTVRAELLVRTIDELRQRRGRMRLPDQILYAVAVLGPGGGCLARPAAWANVRKVARLAAEFEQLSPRDPAAFLAYLDDRERYVLRESATGGAAEGHGAVRIMTVHAAKGLEFPIVAVADLGRGAAGHADDVLLLQDDADIRIVDRGVGPSERRELGGEPGSGATAWKRAAEASRLRDLAEAKRVFYVACTRAEQVLILAGSADLSKPVPADSAIGWVLEASDLAPDAGERGIVPVTVVGGEAPASPEDGVVEVEAEGGGFVRGEAHSLHITQVKRAIYAVPVLRDAGPIRPPEEISYTALALYDACAYRFFSERMLRVGAIDVRTGSDPLALGSALHGALELVARGRKVDADRLRALATAHRLDADASGRLVDALAAVEASGIASFVRGGSPEVPFALRFPQGVVRGSMDLVVRDGGGATVLDYKTGRTWDAEGERYRAQAEVYALALLEAGAAPVTVRFVHVEAGCQEVVFAFQPADAARVRARIEQGFARLQTGEFPPRASFDPDVCADCPVSGGLCRIVHPSGRGPAQSRDRGVQTPSPSAAPQR